MSLDSVEYSTNDESINNPPKNKPPVKSSKTGNKINCRLIVEGVVVDSWTATIGKARKEAKS